MNAIQWTNDMSVGREDFDGHHRMIIDALNRLYPLIGVADRDAELRVVLETLEEFVLLHFAEEEKAMKQAGYPDWPAHKAQHDGMYDLVFKMKAGFDHGRLPDAENIHALLYDWLVKHILGEDRKYIPYLQNPASAGKNLWHRASGRPY